MVRAMPRNVVFAFVGDIPGGAVFTAPPLDGIGLGGCRMGRGGETLQRPPRAAAC